MKEGVSAVEVDLQRGRMCLWINEEAITDDELKMKMKINDEDEDKF